MIDRYAEVRKFYQANANRITHEHKEASMASAIYDLSNERVVRFNIQRDYFRLCQVSWWLRLGAKLAGKPHSLRKLSEVSTEQTVVTRSHAGVKSVPIERIRGSEGRCKDFDAHFRPLNELSRERWVSIAYAQHRDIPLPIVDLVQVDDIYYVRDGHHRISVARWIGQREIEAEVTVWHCRPAEAQPQSQPSAASVNQAVQTPAIGLVYSMMKTGERFLARFRKVQPLPQAG